MTRKEAAMIAEEFLKLQAKRNKYAGEELLSAKNLCERLDVSRSWLDRRSKLLPRIRIGDTWRYPLSKVIETLRLRLYEENETSSHHGLRNIQDNRRKTATVAAPLSAERDKS